MIITTTDVNIIRNKDTLIANCDLTLEKLKINLNSIGGLSSLEEVNKYFFKIYCVANSTMKSETKTITRQDEKQLQNLLTLFDNCSKLLKHHANPEMNVQLENVKKLILKILN